MHVVFNRINRLADERGYSFQEHVGCIEIMDNVFIGSGTTILGNVRIGPNAIVAAGSVVNKDVPPNSIVGGVPAKVIGKFSDLYEKRQNEEYPGGMRPMNQGVCPQLVEYLWKEFDDSHESSS
jgi:Serine acetyltransferase